jgi:dipeptidyl aminopeptidase/acylaminoacyl peptidase
VRRLLALSVITPLIVAANFTPEQAPLVFGQREMASHMDISPDGRSVVYISPGKGKNTIAYVASLDSKTPKAVLSSNANPESLSWCNFVSNTRLVCKITALTDYEGRIIPASRLFAVNTDGSNAKPLGQRGSMYDERIRQFDGEVLDYLPGGEGGAVLMAREYVPEVGRADTKLARKVEGLGVDKVDTLSLASTAIERPNKQAGDFMTDGRGNVRVMTVQPVAGATGYAGSKVLYKYRTPDSSEWKDLGDYDINTRQGLVPLAVDGGINSAYVLKKLNGRWALYRVKLDGSAATELVYSNPKVDVDDVVRIGKGQRVIGVTYTDDVTHTVYFDPEFKSLAGALSKALPNLPLVQFGSASADGAKLLIFAGSDTDPGRWYVYDKSKRGLEEIMLARPALEGAQLARVKTVSYPAADGTQIPAYLTLPPGKESAKGLPAVVMPHGGPESRDYWGFDWLVQFLAYKGYAVLQPQYRGSAGYGDEWLMKNGFQSWKTSIGDVTASAKWLAAQGIADPKKLAIVGWSYGGYAALQSDVSEPGLFKAVVAIAPVTDLDMVKEEARYFSNKTLTANYIGTGPHIREGSPLQNVGRIAAPVLLVHGDRDLNVGVRQSRKMAEALKAAGKKSDYIEYPGLEHSLVDSTVRAQMLEKIAAFLAANVK